MYGAEILNINKFEKIITNKNGLKWSGNDLLSHTLRCSTIGAKVFHCPVRDGMECYTLAKITRSFKPAFENLSNVFATKTSLENVFTSGLNTVRHQFIFKVNW